MSRPQDQNLSTSQVRRATYAAVICILLVLGLPLLALAQDSPDDTIWKARRLADSRSKIEQSLVRIVDASGEAGDLATSRQLALEMLGEVGTILCVPILIKHLGDFAEWKPAGGESQDRTDLSGPTPAMRGLSGLGPVAVKPLVDAYLAEADKASVQMIERALENLPCRELVVSLVASRWRGASEPDARCRLDALHVRLTGKSLSE